MPDTNATIVTVPTLQSAKEAQVGQKIIGIHIGSTVVVDALLPITDIIQKVNLNIAHYFVCVFTFVHGQ